MGNPEGFRVGKNTAPVLLGPGYDRRLAHEQHLLSFSELARDAGELVKLIRTKQIDAQLFYYRTRSGMEVDFLLQTPAGIIAVEVKNREHVDGADTGAMRAVASALGERWLGGLVVCRGNRIQELAMRGLPFDPQRQLNVFYKGIKLDPKFIPDLFVCDEIIVELKAVKKLLPEHEAQLINYLAITGKKVGYLINFGHSGSLEWKRIVL